MNEIEDEDEIEDRSWRWNEPEHAREFLVDDLEGDTGIKLRIAGDKLQGAGEEDLAAVVEATVDVDGDWQLTQRFRYDPSRTPTKRMSRRTIDSHRARINTLLRDSLKFDDETHEQPRWRPVVSGRWRISEIRSGRGAKPEIDLDEIEKRRAAGDTLPRIAADLGPYHQQSLANARRRKKRRSLDDDRKE